MGSKVFAEAMIQGSQGSIILDLEWALIPVTGVLIGQREDTEAHGRWPREDWGGDGRDAPAGPGMAGASRMR